MNGYYGPVKMIGRPRPRREFGFEYLHGFLEMTQRLRGIDMLRPRGVFRFKTFEEADAWWRETGKPRFRAPQT